MSAAVLEEIFDWKEGLIEGVRGIDQRVTDGYPRFCGGVFRF
jgi:hypothetical protein